MAVSWWRQIFAGAQDLAQGVLEWFGLGDAARAISDFDDDSAKANALKAKLEAKLNAAIAKAGYDRDSVYNSLYKLRNSPLRGKQLQNALNSAMKRADAEYTKAVNKTVPIQTKIAQIDRDVISGKPSQVLKYDSYWDPENTKEINKLIEKEI